MNILGTEDSILLILEMNKGVQKTPRWENKGNRWSLEVSRRNRTLLKP